MCGWSKKCPDQCSRIILRFYAFPRKYISANSFSYKCTLWSIFGPCLCIKSCKPNLYALLLQIWTLTQFTQFIWKIFAFSDYDLPASFKQRSTNSSHPYLIESRTGEMFKGQARVRVSGVCMWSGILKEELTFQSFTLYLFLSIMLKFSTQIITA